MGRQRMISDSIWTDPKLAHLSSEDLFTNVVLLTNRDSNVIGVYQTMWRAVGSGLGWTEQQMLTKARDLAAKGVIAIDEQEGWVWVKNWWDHNSLRAAFVGNVAKKARAEFNKVPSHWKDAVYTWLSEHDEDGACESLATPSKGPCRSLDRSSQGSGGNLNLNPSNSSTTTPTPIRQIGVTEDVLDLDDLVEAAVWATTKTGAISNEAGFRHKVMMRIRTSGVNAADLQSLAAWQVARATSESKARALQVAKENAELSDLERNHERETLEAAFNTLDETYRQEFISSFDEHLSAASPAVHKLFKKHGVSSPVVRGTFFQFLKTSPVFSHHADRI